MSRVALILAGLAAACGASGSGETGGPIDAGAAIDAPPAVCHTERMINVIADREILEGDFCDDISLCAADRATADAVTAIIDGFACDPHPVCPDALRCQWSDPDVLDADEYRGLCAISSLESEPQLRCMIYLGAY
jgi:hypothetical protein